MTLTHSTTTSRRKSAQAGALSSQQTPESLCASPQTDFKSSVPAVEQAIRVLLCLGDSPDFKMRLTDICERVGISKSKGHAILHTLKRFELIDQDPQTKTFSLGPALIFLSQRVLDNLSYPEIVSPFLTDLVKETNGTAAFGLISDLHVFIIAKREGNQNIGFRLPLGHKFHITLGAHGKAIVAFMDDTERAKVLSRKRLYFYGDSAQMDLSRLQNDMAQCRQLGFADDIGQVTPGVTVLSSPVFAIRERMVGCIILIGTGDVSKIPEYGTKLMLAAKQVSRKLGAHVDTIFPP